jgi:transcriptional regulator GlxA family with amidase domain
MMGETVNDTIRRKRLHQSAVWLISSNLSVAAIASRAKFASVQAYTVHFVTPMAYHPQSIVCMDNSLLRSNDLNPPIERRKPCSI